MGRIGSGRLLPTVVMALVLAGGVAVVLDMTGWRPGSSDPVPTGPISRTVAVVVTSNGTFPSRVYLEEGVGHRLAFVSVDDAYTLHTPDLDLDVDVSPDELAWVDVPSDAPGSIRFAGDDFEGPLVELVAGWDEVPYLVAAQEVAIVAVEDGLVPQEPVMVEGMPVIIGGTSLVGERVLRVEGSPLEITLSPGSGAPRALMAPAPGTYTITCTDGCGPGGTQDAASLQVVSSSAATRDGPWVQERQDGVGGNVGQMAPDFQLFNLDGDMVRLVDFRGEKAVFINFWATWCVPCRDEMPAMQDLYSHRQDEVEILAINLQERQEQASAFMEELSLTFPALLDPTGMVARRYGAFGLPTSVFVDKEGVVQARHMGEMSRSIMDHYTDQALHR